MLDLGMAVIDDACDNAAEGEFTSDVLKAQSCFDLRISAKPILLSQKKSLKFLLCAVSSWELSQSRILQ